MQNKILIYLGLHKMGSFVSAKTGHDLCYGFEANPRLAKIAEETYKEQSYVKIINAAVSDKNGEADFFIYDPDSSSSLSPFSDSYLKNTGVKFELKEKIKIPTINIYDFCIENNITEIETFFSDLEGNDYTVLKTMKPFIKEKRIRYIQCEVEIYKSGRDQCHNLLNLNYKALFDELLDDNYVVIFESKHEDTINYYHYDVLWKVKE